MCALALACAHTLTPRNCCHCKNLQVSLRVVSQISRRVWPGCGKCRASYCTYLRWISLALKEGTNRRKSSSLFFLPYPIWTFGHLCLYKLRVGYNELGFGRVQAAFATFFVGYRLVSACMHACMHACLILYVNSPAAALSVGNPIKCCLRARAFVNYFA